MRKVSAAVSLFVFWVLLSGYFTPFLLGAGAVCAIAVVAFGRRLEVVDPEGHPVDFSGSALRYWPWLGLEIVKSAWDVSKIILDPRLPITPTLVEFTPAQTTDIGLVIHANSITLTPGTITVEAELGRFLVHALTREAAASLAGSEMDRRCAVMEMKP